MNDLNPSAGGAVEDARNLLRQHRRCLSAALALVVAATLCSCANPAPGSAPAGAASLSPSVIVYPAPGTAAVEGNATCQDAHNTAIPIVKRSAEIDFCDQQLSHANEPVTKPVTPDLPADSAPPPLLDPSAADCAPDALSAEFRGAGFSEGSDFGGIVIFNPQPQACTVRGPATFTAYLADGTLDRAATVNRITSFPPTTLPGRMLKPGSNSDPSDYIFASLMGLERDDSTQPNGSCRRQDEITPATLVLNVGALRFSVSNYQASALQIKAVYGCHGSILLEDISGPTQH